MFLHKNQLQHILKPCHYHDPRQHRTEVERLFRPGWHCVATTADLPRPGDFLTLELFGEPVLVRNVDGDIRAYQNVCPHRHCLLTHEARGHAPHFRCQYHGWEYQKDGSTARIPDAGCFRPWDRDNAHLRTFRTAVCGQLVFVSLADAGPDLAEYLGPFYHTCAELFAPAYRQVWKWEATYFANWKVPVENSLESYHLPLLHRKTFGNFPPEEACQHLLAEHYTSFHTSEVPSWAGAVQNWFVRRLGGRVTNQYLHHHLHPNLIFTGLDVHRTVQMIFPISPTTCRHIVWAFTLHGNRGGVVSWLLAKTLAWLVVKVASAIHIEDERIFAEVQRGLQASHGRGVIGTREERLYAFQQYVARGCGLEIPAEALTLC